MSKLFRNVLICCLLSTTYYLLLYSYPSGWSNDILLSPDDPKHRSQSDLGVDGFNNVWAVWDTGTWVAGTAEVLYSKRDSLGACLIPETGVSNNTSYSTGPRIAVDGSDNIQFVWLDQTPQGIGLWHAKLAADGSMIVPAHMAVSGNNDLFPFEMVLDKYKEIDVAWDERDLNFQNQIIFTKLDSLGNPIIPKIRISPDSIPAYWTGIGVDSFANCYIGYRTNATSTDSLTYTKVDRDGNILIDNKVLDTGLLPSIIADKSQNIHMVYPHPGPTSWVINYLKLDQEGNIIIAPKTISIYETYNMGQHMAMDSLQYLHVVWTTDSSGTFPIMYAKLDTMGDFIIPPMQVVYPPYTQGGGAARIAVDLSNRLHLVWVDERLNPGVSTAIFYKRGENVGIEETARLKTVGLPGISVFPNPFSKTTKISISTEQSADGIELRIYDASGRLIKDFLRFTPDALRPTLLVWDGTDNKGDYLPAGVYFLRLSHSAKSQSVPLVLLR
ncbi:MAG: T9SS type A sorting domain-containing protein [bacterium]